MLLNQNKSDRQAVLALCFPLWTIQEVYDEEGQIDSVKTIKKIIFLTWHWKLSWPYYFFFLKCTVKHLEGLEGRKVWIFFFLLFVCFCFVFFFAFHLFIYLFMYSSFFFLQKISCNSISKSWMGWKENFPRMNFALQCLLETNNPRLS